MFNRSFCWFMVSLMRFPQIRKWFCQTYTFSCILCKQGLLLIISLRNSEDHKLNLNPLGTPWNRLEPPYKTVTDTEIKTSLNLEIYISSGQSFMQIFPNSHLSEDSFNFRVIGKIHPILW